MSSRLSSIAVHALAAGLSVLLTVLLLARGPDRTVALSRTRQLETQAGPPREIRLILENQLSHLAASISGQRLTGQEASEGPPQVDATTHERVLRWGTIELPMQDSIKQTMLARFLAEVRDIEGDPNQADPNTGAAPAGSLDPNQADPNTGPALATARDPNQADPNAAYVLAGAWDPNGWSDRCISYEGIVSACPDAASRIAVANQIGMFLCHQRQLQEAVRWFEHILSDADRRKLGDYVRLNMALTYLDLAQTVEARGVLQTILDNSGSAEADPRLWGLHVMAAGIMSNVEQVEGNLARATECLDQTRRRLEARAAQLPDEAWPTFYMGMVHVWRLRIAVEYSGTGQHPALAELHKEFLKAVPLSRWTWLQHQVFRDMLAQRPLPGAAVAAAPDASEGQP